MRPALFPPMTPRARPTRKPRAASDRCSASGGFAAAVTAVDALLENGRWLEHHDPARRDRNFLAGLRIAADALAFLAHDERAERRQFHSFAAFKAVGDLLEHQLYQSRRFRARQSNFLIDRLTQIRPCDRLSRHRQPRAR